MNYTTKKIKLPITFLTIMTIMSFATIVKADDTTENNILDNVELCGTEHTVHIMSEQDLKLTDPNNILSKEEKENLEKQEQEKVNQENANNLVSSIESSKNEQDLQKTQDAINLITTPEIKESLQNRLNTVSSEIEQAKQKAVLEQQAASQSTTQQTSTTTTQSVASSNGTKQFGVNQAREAFEQIVIDLNVSESEKTIWSDIITRESGWNTQATNPSSGAYGLPQSLPGEKMASVGSDYLTNPYTQLMWMYKYVHERYGSFAGVDWYSRGWY